MLNQKGLSLLEILLAVFLVVIVVTMALPSFNRISGENLRSSTRKIIAVIKGTYDLSVFQNKIIRLVFDIEKNRYWIEVSNNAKGVKEFNVNLENSDEQIEQEENKSANGGVEEGNRNKRDAIFVKDTSLGGKEFQLPNGVVFRDVHLKRNAETTQRGKAFLYFFPQGYVEPAIIHVGVEDQENVTLSLRTRPLTGKVTLYEQMKEFKDFKDYEKN